MCDPYFGATGPAWERIFSKDFLAAARSKSDKFSNMHEHSQGRDPGGMRTPTAAQLAANPNHLNVARGHAGGAADVRESQQAFEQRSQDMIAALRQHIPVARLQNAIDAMVEKSESNAPDQPCLNAMAPPVAGGVPIYPAAHPLAVGVATPLTPYDLAQMQKYGNSLARHVFGMLEGHGIKAASGLKTLSQEGSWVNR